MTRIGLIAAAAMLAGGASVALAQTATTPSTAVNQDKCWDAATNQVRDKTTGSMAATGSTGMTGSTSTTGNAGTAGSTATTGSGTTGTTSTSPGAGSPGSAATTAETRPAGMPNC